MIKFTSDLHISFRHSIRAHTNKALTINTQSSLAKI